VLNTLTQKGLFVVIPAYNEVATIADIAQRSMPHAERVIVVNDASTDNTAAALDGLPVTLLQHPHNRGKAAALETGFLHALSCGASHIITLDADGQHHPEDIPRLFQAAQRSPGDIIIGARLRKQSSAPALRLFANRFANFWISWAAGYRIQDSQSGFRLYPAALLNDVKLSAERSRCFVYESEILIAASWAGYGSRSVMIDSVYHEARRPSHYRPWQDTAAIIRMVAGRLLSRGMYLRGLLQILSDNRPLLSGENDLHP
jgi:glycosyltransferase involved in cell wall biosynthesis